MNEGDHDLDAAWRAASREAPSTMLDDAIRAAARREVGAGPQRLRATHWWPLAAAATVAALAIGIVQLTPPDEVVATAPREAAPAPERQQVAAAPAGSASNVPERRDAASGRDALSVGPAPAETSPARVMGSIAAAPERGAPKVKAEHEASRQRDAAAPGATVPPTTDAPAGASTSVATTPVPEQQAARSEDPFPAAPAAPAVVSRSASPQPPADVVPSLSNARRATEEAREATDRPGNAFALRGEQESAARATAKTAMAKDVPARPVDEWVTLIRRLRSEGKTADAARELAAFHDAYKDRAEALLPSDLREAKP